MVEQQENKPEQPKEEEQVRPEYFDEGVFEHFKEEVPVVKIGNPTFGGGGRVRVSKIYEDHTPFLNKIITVAGWSRNTRAQGKQLVFIELTDGSCMGTLQVVIDSAIDGFEQIHQSKLGASFKLTGTLIKSPKKGQLFELQVSQNDRHKAILFGHCDNGTYPFAGKKAHTMEHLRDHAHLRPRTKLISSVARVRSSLAFATHQFFQQQGIQYLHAPIITASDCEGAGEMFQVTSMLPEAHKPLGEMKYFKDLVEETAKKEAEEAKKKEEEKVAAEGSQAAEKQEGEKPAEEGAAEVEQKMSKAQLKKLAKQKEAEKKKAEKAAKQGGAKAAPAVDNKKEEEQKRKQEEEKKWYDEQEAKMLRGEISWKDFRLDYRKDFFSKPAFLTVSGQLSAENYATAMGDVYTFGPTFRAEDSHTSRHLAEFWMIEPELSFISFDELKDNAEGYLKYCLKFVLENNRQDIEFLEKLEADNIKAGHQAKHELPLIQRLEHVIQTPFERLTYSQAVERLIKEGDTPNFEQKVEWGIDLGSEHERYLVEKIYKGPVILSDYPKKIKAFYMRLNDDDNTVQALDVLAPAIGEIIGGSMREERLDVLDRMMEEKGLEVEKYEWYRDLRKFGTVPHGGYGLGFERLVMMATGIENIRDVIPFPRFPGNADF